MATTYRSQIGLEIVLPIAVVLAFVSIIMICGGAWPGVMIIIVAAAFIGHMFATTYYVLSDTELVIRCGFLVNQTIKTDTIRRITETRNPLSSPATSLDRLEIAFGRFDTVMISPKDKAGFIAHLTQLKPNIEIILRKH